MKCSKYLWKFVELQRLLRGESPERVQGELRSMLGREKIVSDTDGAYMTEREALSVLGRNEAELRRAYELGRVAVFEGICMGQQISDDEWDAAQEEALREWRDQQAAGGASPEAGEKPPEAGEAE